METLILIIKAIITTIGGGLLASKTGFFVRTGEVGVTTTFGKVKRDKNGQIILLKEGFRIVIPHIQTIVKTHFRKNTQFIEGLSITLSNGLTYGFNAYIVYHVGRNPIDVENVLFGLGNLKEFVKITLEKTVQQALEGMESVDNSEANTKLKEAMYKVMAENGMVVDDCGLSSFYATDYSQTLLGINYKIEIAKKMEVPQGLMAAILGATPTINAENTSNTVINNIEKED